MKTLFSILFMLLPFAGHSGELPDSLQALMNRSASDTGRINILLKASNSATNPDPEQATRYAGLALQMALKAGDKALVAQSYYRLGTNAYVMKTLKESHMWFLKAAALYDALHDYEDKGFAYSALGDVLGDEKDGKKSIYYYSLAKQNFLLAHDTVHAIYMDMSVAGVLGQVMNLYDSALSYSISILPAARQVKNEELQNMILANIAVFYQAKGDNEKALEYCFKSLPFFETRGDPVLAAMSYGTIATIYQALKDYRNAEKYARLEYESYKKGKSQKGVALAMQRLGEAYTGLKDYERAASWYLKVISLKDTLFSTDIAAQVAEMQTKYETEKKDQELALQSARLDRQQILIYGGVGFLIFILGASALLWFNYGKINRLSKTLALQKVELEELNTVKDKLFSAISHDLRSPLGRITNMLYMMQRGSVTEEKLKERTTEFLGAMQQTMQMLDNLLYWATSQMKGLSLNKSDINIRELVEENMELMQSEAALKKIEMIEKIEKTAIALADVNMTRLVLRNLISNAIKFTPENGMITVSAETVNNGVRVQVKDNGVGISAETIEAVYANKHVTSKSGTRAEKGFGIGLQLCNDFIEQNGGKLEIASEQGMGSTFSFTLPTSR